MPRKTSSVANTHGPSNDNPAPRPKEEPLVEDASDDLELTATSQTAEQKALLERTARFLVNIQGVTFSARAARNGYDAAAHAEGWKLYNKAAGADRPLEHWFGEQAQMADAEGLTGDRLSLLTDIDAFENVWFPRVRAIIRRVVPRDSRDAFAAAFFANLTQQPLGPGVVGSVATLLQRVDGLEKSKEPGAKEVLATLRQRGLTTRKVAEVRALLKEAEEGARRAAPVSPVTPAQIAQAQADQEEAFEDLRDWFNDWGTHLRSVFNVRHQIILGLTVRTARNGAAAEEPANDTPSAENAPAVNKGGTANKAPPATGTDK